MASGLAAVGVAGAAEQRSAAPPKIYASDDLCFTTDPTRTCNGTALDVPINTGETVEFDFLTTVQPHNAAADRPDNTYVAWTYSSGAPTGGHVPTQPPAGTFNNPGKYHFICNAHPIQMTGTITVTGPPIGTPTPSPSATPTPTPDQHTETPPPSPPPDTIKPRVRSVSLSAIARGARVRFRLSEPATVTVTLKKGKKLVKRSTVHASAGRRTVTLRTHRLKRGRYTVQVVARDAKGNRSTVATDRLRVGRR